MGDLTEIRQAYERLRDLLDQEILNRRGEAAALERFGKRLDTAFYPLAWANFEHPIRKRAEAIAFEGARSRGRERHGWAFLADRIRDYPMRRQLDLVFHDRPRVIADLKKQYTVRNEAAHDYKRLPPEARDLPDLIGEWERLVDRP